MQRNYTPQTISLIRTVTTASAEIVCERRGNPNLLALTEPRVVTSTQLELLLQHLLNSESYFQAVKRCIPRPTVRFQMQSDDAQLSVTVDFACMSWIVETPTDRSASFFDPVRDQMLSLVKELFPEYASPDSRSVWRSGVINELTRAATD